MYSYLHIDNEKDFLAPLRKKYKCLWSYFILCAHKECFESAHRLRHRPLRAVVQRKAQQEDQAGVQERAHDAAGQNRAVPFTTSLRGDRWGSGERLWQTGRRCCGCFDWSPNLWEDVGQSAERETPLLGELTPRQQEELLQGVTCPLMRHQQNEPWQGRPQPKCNFKSLNSKMATFMLMLLKTDVAFYDFNGTKLSKILFLILTNSELFKNVKSVPFIYFACLFFFKCLYQTE